MNAHVLSFILGIILSYFIVSLAIKKTSLDKFLNLIFGVYFSLIVLMGFITDHFMLPLSTIPLVFIIVFLLCFKAIIRQKTVLEWDKKDILILGLVFIVSFGIYLYPSLPYFSPICYGGDCNTHNVYVFYIYDMDALERGVNYGYVDFRTYPFGFHLNAAILSHALGVLPIYVSQLFLNFLTVMTVLCSYGMAKDLTKNRITALITPLFVITSVYPIGAMIIGFWPHVAGIYLAVLFFWLLSEYKKTKDKGVFFILLLIEFALVLTYNVIALIPLFAFLVLMFKVEGSWKERIAYSFLFLAVITILVVQAVLDMSYDVGFTKDRNLFTVIKALVEYQTRGNLINDGLTLNGDVNNIGFHIIILCLLGILFHVVGILRRKKHNPEYLIVVSVIFVQIVVTYFLHNDHSILKEGLSPYYFHKNFFLLIYPLAAYSALGFDVIIGGIRSLKLKGIKKPVKILLTLVFILMILALMNAKTIKSDWIWKDLGPFGGMNTFLITYLERDYPCYLLGDFYKYGRTGDIPALYDAAQWIKNNRNCSHEPCQGVIYYSGPYDALWLYGMTRHRILVEANNARIPTLNKNMLTEENILYKKNDIYLYKNQVNTNATVLRVYQNMLDTIQPQG